MVFLLRSIGHRILHFTIVVFITVITMANRWQPPISQPQLERMLGLGTLGEKVGAAVRESEGETLARASVEGVRSKAGKTMEEAIRASVEEYSRVSDGEERVIVGYTGAGAAKVAEQWAEEMVEDMVGGGPGSRIRERAACLVTELDPLLAAVSSLVKAVEPDRTLSQVASRVLAGMHGSARLAIDMWAASFAASPADIESHPLAASPPPLLASSIQAAVLETLARYPPREGGT